MRLANPASIPRSEKILGKANCLAGDAVGNCVVIAGPRVGGKYQVRKIDPATDAHRAVGIIISKSGTDCVVQFAGPMTNVYNSLSPGDVYYVGADGNLTDSPPVVNGKLYTQVMGVALDADVFLVDLSVDGSGACCDDSSCPAVTDIYNDANDNVEWLIRYKTTARLVKVKAVTWAYLPNGFVDTVTTGLYLDGVLSETKLTTFIYNNKGLLVGTTCDTGVPFPPFYGDKVFAFRTSNLVSITIPGSSNVKILGVAELPSTSTASVGDVETTGLVVAAHQGTFGDHSLDAVTGKTAVAPKNLVRVFDDSTNTQVLSANGSPIFGLLQSENAADGHTVSDTTPNRVQISLVRMAAGGATLEAAPISEVEGLSLKYAVAERETLINMDQDAFLEPFYPASGGGGGGGGGGSGSIAIEDVLERLPSPVPQWQDSPNDTVLQSCSVPDGNITVRVRSSYPLVEVNGTPATLTKAADGYTGDVAITIAGAGAISVTAVALTPDDTVGASDTCAVTIDLPPALTALAFTGPYPTGPGGLQTEVRAGDTFDVAWTADKLTDRIQFQNTGAGTNETIVVSPPALSGTVTMTVANRGTSPQALAATAQARDSVSGAYGPTRATDLGGGVTDGEHLITLNNLYPSGAVSIIDYPVTQGALKLVEQATVNHTASNYDSVAYTDPTGTDLSIANPATFEAAKVVTCLNPGDYNETATNFRYVLTRNANGAQTTVNGVVLIQDVAPLPVLSLPFARLRSGGNNGTVAQDYTLTLTSDQLLAPTPTLATDSGGNRGTFTTPFAVGGTARIWTRTLRVDETVPDEKGTFAFESLSATNLAGINTTIIAGGASYTLGGFVARTLTFPNFLNTIAIGTAVVDFSKLTAGIFSATNQTAIKQAIGTPEPVTDGYTVNAGAQDTIIWLDTPTYSVSTGAQILDVEETV